MIEQTRREDTPTTTTVGRLLWRWLPPILWMAAIFLASGRAPDDVPRFGVWDLLVKKGGHFVAYALLFWLARRATGEEKWALVITAVYAITDEYHQSFVPGRNGQLVDVLIDWSGAAALWLAIRWRQRRA